MAKLLTRVLLPLVFPLLAFRASQLILGQSLRENGLEGQMAAICTAGIVPHPYLLKYTGNIPLDRFLCALIVFFHALMDTAYYPLLAVLFPAIGVVILIPWIESVRNRRPLVLGAPTPFGILLQLFSMGVIIPIYSFLFVVTGAASLRANPTPSLDAPFKISRANGESILFGFFVGYVLPTVLMLYFVDPSLTVLWQGVPFLVALATFAYRLIGSLFNTRPVYATVMATLASAFIISVVLHAIYVWPILTDISALRWHFVPIDVAHVANLAATPIPDGAHEFIKWDIIFAMGSMMLSTLWMANSMLSFVSIITWHGVATIMFGPAAAIIGVFIWREKRLNKLEKTDTQKVE